MKQACLSPRALFQVANPQTDSRQNKPHTNLSSRIGRSTFFRPPTPSPPSAWWAQSAIAFQNQNHPPPPQNHFKTGSLKKLKPLSWSQTYSFLFLLRCRRRWGFARHRVQPLWPGHRQLALRLAQGRLGARRVVAQPTPDLQARRERGRG